MTTEGHHPHPAPDRKPRRRTTTETTVGRAARPASLAFPLRPASSRGDRGPREDWTPVAEPSRTVAPDAVDNPFYYGEPSVYVQAAPRRGLLADADGFLCGAWAQLRRVFGPMTPRRRERLHGEVVVRPVPEARPVPLERGEVAHRPLPPPQLHITIEQPGMVAPPVPEGWPTWKRLVGFVATIIGTALLLIALLGPPHIVQSHHRPPDLVNPSR